MAKEMNTIDWIAWVLVIIGGLNWGLVGAFWGFDIVDAIFGAVPILRDIIYILVGLGALYMLIAMFVKK